jgi:hypothetical protein
MIKEQTILVLGAGASKPYGFPTGDELRQKILMLASQGECRKMLAGTFNYRSDMIDTFRSDYLRTPISIDAFLEKRYDYMDLGKTLIAMALLPCEHSYQIFEKWIQPPHPQEHPREKPTGSWYELLYNSLITDTTFKTFSNNKLSIITFNYDRSLEYFLYESLRPLYKSDFKEQAEFINILNTVQIVHVYGNLGLLPWEDRDSKVEYSPDISASKLLLAQNNITLLSEGQHCKKTQKNLTAAHKLINGAKNIYFLGFGYHTENLKRLDTVSYASEQLLTLAGTHKGLDVTKYNKAKEILKTRDIRMEWVDCDVYDFLHDRYALD